MKHTIALTISTLLTMLLLIFHVSDEISRGLESGKLPIAWAMLVLVFCLYATLMLIERRSGLVVILLFSLLGTGVPIIHMMGGGLAGGKTMNVNANGIFFWVVTLLVMELTAGISVVLAVHGLWKLRRANQPPANK